MMLEIHLVRRPFIERPMKPLFIKKLEIVVQATPSRLNRVIRMKIDMFIFHCPPETFNENVVIHSACSSPTDANVSRFKPSGKGTNGGAYESSAHWSFPHS